LKIRFSFSIESILTGLAWAGAVEWGGAAGVVVMGKIRLEVKGERLARQA
jgi:hypothetical protein